MNRAHALPALRVQRAPAELDGLLLGRRWACCCSAW